MSDAKENSVFDVADDADVEAECGWWKMKESTRCNDELMMMTNEMMMNDTVVIFLLVNIFFRFYTELKFKICTLSGDEEVFFFFSHFRRILVVLKKKQRYKTKE